MKTRFFWFRFLRFLVGAVNSLVRFIRSRINRNVRLELMLTFALCLICSIVVFIISVNILGKQTRTGEVGYSWGIYAVDEEARVIEHRFENNNYDISSDKDRVEIQHYINKRSRNGDIKVLISDMDGNVILKSGRATETKVDVHSIISNVMDMRINGSVEDECREIFSFYPVNFKDTKAYLIVSGTPIGDAVYHDRGMGGFLAATAAFAAFIVMFFLLTKKRMRYIEEIAKGLLEISKGNLDFRVNRKGEDELGSLADNINYMAGELKSRIEKERENERVKNELITNVSHDLRTPLTSIMGYLRLLKDKKYEDRVQLENYIDIAYDKSEKLETLVEDLFEYTKTTDKGIKLNRREISLNGLLEQLIEELVPICEENNLVISKKLSREKIIVEVDGDKMVRVFENLLTNAIRYSHKPGEIEVTTGGDENYAMVSVKNRGDVIHEEEMAHLFDRFYRLEKSRASDTGGLGLGLAIAKSIVEMHGGKIHAECHGDEIIFFVHLIRV